jgi:hypothetical protein
MGYEGDDSVTDAEALLAAFLRAVEPKMKRNAHLAIFWTFRNLDICIDTLRATGFMCNVSRPREVETVSKKL